jgi:endonuclease-3
MVTQKTALKQFRHLKKKIKGHEMRLAAEWPEGWQILISTIISPQTKDEVTIEVCEVLFDKYPSIERLGRARTTSIENIIKKANYYKTKAKHISKTCKLLTNKKIPETVKELTQLPGVGRKVANVYLNEALKKQAIAVDTHVARIAQKLQWTKNTHPDKIEKELEQLFPKKYWKEINHTLVIFGKAFSTSRKKEDEILKELQEQTR